MGDPPCHRLDSVDGVIVVACETEDRATLNRLVPSDVPVFRGEGDDALARFCKALEQFPAEGVVRVRGDNLFIDPGLIDRLIQAAESHPSCDYVSYSSRDGRPAILSPVGVFAEWFRASALRKAERLAGDDLDREDVTRYIYSHPETFNLRLVPAPSEIDRDDVRLTVDIEEDWDHVLMMFEALERSFGIGSESPGCWTTSRQCEIAWRCSIGPMRTCNSFVPSPFGRGLGHLVPSPFGRGLG